MVCPSCNSPNRDDAKFCKRCGQPLHPQQVAASESDQVPATPASVQEFAETLSTQEEAGEQESEYAPVQDVDDLSLEPTLILTPDKMLAYHSRRWQREIERTVGAPLAGALEANTTESQSTVHTDIADAPAAWSLPSPDEQSQAAAGSTDTANKPAISHPPA